MERSFAAMAGFEHEAELVTGYDALLDHVENHTPKTPEAVYTETVLKLDAGTYDIVDGQEGFLDTIKRGATKVYEWIKSIIRAIRNWFSGGNKKEYDQATKELQKKENKLWAENKVKELTNKGLDAVLREDDSGQYAVISKIAKANKSEAEEAYDQAVEEFNASEDSGNVVTDKVIDDIIAKINVRMAQIKTRVTEIKRIDPEYKTFKEVLGIPKWEYVESFIDKQGPYIDNTTNVDFFVIIKELLKLAGNAQADLSVATGNLDKYNLKHRNDETGDVPRILSRSGAILKELAEIASIYRDVIITVNSQLEIQYKKVEQSLLKSTLLILKHRTDIDASNYINEAISNM